MKFITSLSRHRIERQQYCLKTWQQHDSHHEDFQADWEPERGKFNVGIRYDFDDVGFVIGVSVWDYWMVWHMMTERFRIKAKTTPGLLHLRHPQNWGERDTEIGLSIMRSV